MADISASLEGLGGQVLFNTDIPDLIDRIRVGQRLAHQVVPVAAVPLVLLAWFVIFLAVGYGAEARRFELGLLALRGTRLPIRWWLAVGENVLPIIVGAVGGFFAGQVAVALLARARLGESDTALLSTAGWRYALVAGAGAVLCALLAQRRGIATPVASLLRRVVRPAPAWQALALELLVILLAGVAAVQLRVSGGDLTGVALLVPGLVILAIALLAGRAVVPLAARYGRYALRRGRTGTGLAALQLARRPGAQRLLVLLTVAVALLSFAATATDVAGHARANEAEIATGAPRVVTVNGVTRTLLLQTVHDVDPQGKFAMAAVVLEGGGPDEPPTIAVDSPRLAAVASWRGDFGSASPAELAAKLHPTSSDTVIFTGTLVHLDATATGFDPRADLRLTMGLAPLDGSPGITVDFGPLQQGQETYAAGIRDCAKGCRLINFEVKQGALGGYHVTLSLHALTVTGSTGVSTEQFADIGRWLATPSAKLSGGADGLTVALVNSSGLASEAWVKPNDAPYPLPVVSTEGLADDATIGGLGAAAIAQHQVARVAGLPGLGDRGSMIDLEYADRVADDSGFAENAQIWLGPATPANVLQLLADHGLVVREDQTSAQLRAGLDGEGPALALWFHLLAAAFAVILATGGIALVAGVDLRRRTEDLAALRLQGLRRRVSSRAGLWGYLVVVLAALACGLVAAGVGLGADGQRAAGDPGHHALAAAPVAPAAGGAAAAGRRGRAVRRGVRARGRGAAPLGGPGAVSGPRTGRCGAVPTRAGAVPTRAGLYRLDDVRDDGGDVVRAAGPAGQVDQARGALLEIGQLVQGLPDGLVGHHVGQAVAAQQVPVGGAEHQPQLGRVQRVPLQRLGHHRLVRVHPGLRAADHALVDQRLDERVVPGDLGERAVAQPVGARVADVQQGQLVTVAQQGGDSGPHPLARRVGGGRHPHLVVGRLHGGAQQRRPVAGGDPLLVERGQRPHHDAAGQVTGGQAAHAIGDGDQGGTGVCGVLVVRPDHAEVTDDHRPQGQGHGCSLPNRGDFVIRHICVWWGNVGRPADRTNG